MTTRHHGDTRPFRLGFLTHVHGHGKPSGQVYAELLDTIQAAEELGFDGVFLAQHHFQTDLSRLPSPLVVLAAAAARTSRIALGTAISTIPLEDPLRLAEDVAVLDELSGGRVQLGLGTGRANLAAFDAFGVPPEQIDDRYDAGVQLLHDATEGRPLRGTSLTLQPAVPGLRGRLWQATARVDKAEQAARAGDGLLIGTFSHRPEDDQLPLIRAYLDAYPDAGPGGGPVGGHGGGPRIGAVRAVFPGVSRASALADLGRGLRLFREKIGASPYAEVVAGLDDAALAARLNVHYGTPEQVVDGLRADPALFGYIDWFLPVVQHEASAPADDIARLELLATRIAPALGWSPAAGAVQKVATDAVRQVPA
jgi:alkanesulfonate monooxygenase SsuD/methylene tetrahydromethanopterin reductase-like flavin-dependent oxidoreductase (luciferase family)